MMEKFNWAIPIGEPLPEGWLPPSNGSLERYQLGKRLGLVALHNSVLHTPAPPILAEGAISEEMEATMERLLQTAKTFRQHGRHLVGLAAAQIGRCEPVFLADVSGAHNAHTLSDLQVFIGSEVHAINSTSVVAAEGCASCGPIFVRLARAAVVEHSGYRPDGKFYRQMHERFAARVMLHEDDHNKGILMVDRALAQGRALDWCPPELQADYQMHTRALDKGESSTWPYQIPPAQWWAMKEGSYSFDNFRLA